MTRRFLYILLCLLPLGLKAQVAGLNTLSVLDMSSSARTAGLGLDYLPLYDDDISITLDNPSFIDSRFNNRVMINYVGMPASAHFGAAAYGRHFDKVGDFIFSLRFNSFGRFEGYDENEISTSSFHAADYVFSIGWGKHIDSSFSIGINFKPVLSQYESYTAFAAAFDVCGSYVSSNKRFAATLMGRNIGAQLATFSGTVEKIPFELSASLSYKLENAPFRVFLAATELQCWNLRYDDPLHPIVTYDPYEGAYTEETFIHEATDKLFRHAVFGVELSIAKVLYARLGYNYRQSAETYGSENINTSGFSYGFGIRKKKFDFAFARNNYYLGKAPTYISISFRI